MALLRRDVGVSESEGSREGADGYKHLINVHIVQECRQTLPLRWLRSWRAAGEGGDGDHGIESEGGVDAQDHREDVLSISARLLLLLQNLS